MAERHPDELDLLDLIEGELPRTVAGSVAAHVEGCPRCTEAVRQLRAGRGALHASGVLQLSDRARDRVTEAIDREPRARRRLLPAFEGRRLGILVAVTLVVLASVLALAQWGGDVRLGGTGDDGGADNGAGEVAGDAEQDAGAGEERAAPETAGGLEPVRVAGPARKVAADLRAEGFDARVVDGAVVVSLDVRTLTGEPEANRLQAILAERPPGRVVVRVEP